MENKISSKKDIPRDSKGCVIVQTCDAYAKYWDSFFWSFYKYWDQNINWPIYFCNEDLEIELNSPFIQARTGKGSHSSRLAGILDALNQYDYVFYMLEDFWMTDRMECHKFMGLFELMQSNNWESLRIAPHMPELYKLEPTNFKFDGKNIYKYAKDSDWKFSQQAAFWKRDFLRQCIIEPSISEVNVSTSLAGEIVMDRYLRENFPDAGIYHYHYHWYPVSGAVWRGELTQMGEQIEFLRKVDLILS
jgi:hypothetical protein